MFLHLGESTVVLEKSIVGIFDMDTATISNDTRDYLKNAEENLKITTVGAEIPKSFVVCTDNLGERIYLSQISTATLNKRKELGYLWLSDV